MGLASGYDINALPPSRGGLYYSGCLAWNTFSGIFGSLQRSDIIKLTKILIILFSAVVIALAALSTVTPGTEVMKAIVAFLIQAEILNLDTWTCILLLVLWTTKLMNLLMLGLISS